jgi:phage terminase small subunit
MAKKKKSGKTTLKKRAGLTDKQKIFREQYLFDSNGTQAAIRAGYSEKTAASIAARLLTKVNIKNWIEEQLKIRADQAKLTKDKVLAHLEKIAFFDMRTLYDEKNELKKVKDFDDNAAAAVGTIEIDVMSFGKGDDKVQVITKKVKPKDSITAIAHINKMMGWNAPEKVDHTTKGESLNDSGIENLSADEKLTMFKLRQKMRGANPVSGIKPT